MTTKPAAENLPRLSVRLHGGLTARDCVELAGVAEQAADKIGSIVFLDAFVPANGESMASITSQAVRDSLKLATERGDIALPFYGNYTLLDQNIKDMSLKLEIDPSGDRAKGMIVGYYDADLLCYEARALFPEGVEPGMRFEGLPDVPTVAEAGVPGFEGGGFLGLVAPVGTPEIVTV